MKIVVRLLLSLILLIIVSCSSESENDTTGFTLVMTSSVSSSTPGTAPNYYAPGLGYQFQGSCTPEKTIVKLNTDAMIPSEVSCDCLDGNFVCPRVAFTGSSGNSVSVTASLTDQRGNHLDKTFAINLVPTAFNPVYPNVIAPAQDAFVTGTCQSDGTQISVTSFNPISPTQITCLCSQGQFRCGPFTVDGDDSDSTLSFVATISDFAGNAINKIDNNVTSVVTSVDLQLPALLDFSSGSASVNLVGTCGTTGTNITVTNPEMDINPATCTCASNTFNCGLATITGSPGDDTQFDTSAVSATSSDTDSDISYLGAVDLNSISSSGYFLGDSVNLTGTCQPDTGNVTVVSPAFAGSPINCSCSGGSFNCGSTTIISLNETISTTISIAGETSPAQTQVLGANTQMVITGPASLVDDGTITIDGNCQLDGDTVTITAPAGFTPSSDICSCTTGVFSCGPFTDPAGSPASGIATFTGSITNGAAIDTDSIDVTYVYIDLDPPAPTGYNIGDSYTPSGSCGPDLASNITITSTGISTSPMTCSCVAGAISCSSTTITATGVNITADIDDGGLSTSMDTETIVNQPNIDITGPTEVEDDGTVNIIGTCDNDGDAISFPAPSGFTQAGGPCICSAGAITDCSFDDTSHTPNGTPVAFTTIIDDGVNTDNDTLNINIVYIDLDTPSLAGFDPGDNYAPTGSCAANGVGVISIASTAFASSPLICDCSSGSISCPNATIANPGNPMTATIDIGGVSSQDTENTVLAPSLNMNSPLAILDDDTFSITGTCTAESDTITITAPAGFTPASANCNCSSSSFSCGPFTEDAGYPADTNPSFTGSITNGTGVDGDTLAIAITAIDLDPPQPTGFDLGDNYTPTGSCNLPGDIVTITSTGIAASPMSCSCNVSENIICASTTITALEVPISASITSNGFTAIDNETINKKPEFDCPITIKARGGFEVGTPSVGTIGIPLIDTVDASLSVTISGGPFSASTSVSITSTDDSIVIPINYDGTGTAGATSSLTISSPDILGSCSGEARIQTLGEKVFGLGAGEFFFDGNEGICAKDTSNSVYCWGNVGNFHGQNTNRSPNLMSMPGGHTTHQISVGGGNAYSLSQSDELVSWGNYNTGANNYSLGRVGSGGFNATTVIGGFPSGVSYIRADYMDACAVLSNNHLWCWGRNVDGELGNGGLATSSVPITTGESSVKDVYIGGDVHCITKYDDKAYCAGDGSNGELGHGLRTIENTFQEVSGLTGIDKLAVMGTNNTDAVCALRTNGEVWCWGYNTRGQVGAGTTTARYTTPQNTGLTNVIDIQVDRYHACAVRNDGTVWCWGENNRGQIGDGTTTDRRSPTQVPGIAGAIQIGLGQDFSCALEGDGDVWCWGENAWRNLGDGTTTDRSSPVQFGSGVGSFPAAQELRVYRYDTCVLAGSDIYCAGNRSGTGATNLASPKMGI